MEYCLINGSEAGNGWSFIVFIQPSFGIIISSTTISIIEPLLE